jgi:hypothetical protein
MGALAQLASGRELVRSSDSFEPITIDDWASLLQASGLLFTPTLQAKIERIENSFPGYLSAAYKGNSAIFALEVVRFLVFSEARFQFRQLRNGRPGDLYGTPELAILENPWGTSSTTGDLLARMLLYADFAGNAYAVRRMGSKGKPVIKLPRPDWMTMIIGSPNADDGPWSIDAELIGFQYHPGGIGYGTPINLLPETVAHFAPIPDPGARFRGMSWITPCIREVEADTSATNHKLAFFRNGATVNSVVTVNNPLIKTPDDFRTWIDLFEAEHKGATNAYQTLYLSNGVDLKGVGSNMEQMEFAKTQGAGESRLAAAAGVPATLVGFSEGLAGSALNAGNYAAAKRRFADATMRPLWRNVAGSVATIINVPGGSELWYDDRDIRFLAEDVKDVAEVMEIHGNTINKLITAGYESQSIIDAVTSGDLTRLVHTGLFSVQLQAPGALHMPAGEVPGEAPVGSGAKPLTLPAGDAATKLITVGQAPPTNGSTPPVRSEDMAEEIRCPDCGKLAGKRTATGGGFETKCRGCGTLVSA